MLNILRIYAVVRLRIHVLPILVNSTHIVCNYVDIALYSR